MSYNLSGLYLPLNLCSFTSGAGMVTCLLARSIRGRGNGTRWRRWMIWTPHGRTRRSCWDAAWCSGATAAAIGVPSRTYARTGAPAVVNRMQYLLSVLLVHIIQWCTVKLLVRQCAGKAYMRACTASTNHWNAATSICTVATQRTRSSTLMCLRRKVPLSEGSVEADGSLMCGYHGWRWNGDGKAIAIPQVPSCRTLK